jgi:outer membrane lipoprotein-sorting protein
MRIILLSILQSLLAALSQQALQSDFMLSVSPHGSQPVTYAGSLTMHNRTFRAQVMGFTAACDGQTLYIYQPEADELTISTPTDEELQMTNPLAFIQAVMPLCNAAERPAKNNSETVITLTPKGTNNAITTQIARFNSITVHVRNADLMPLSVELREADNTSTQLKLKSPAWVTAGSLPADIFTLSQEDFPDTFVNDLR